MNSSKRIWTRTPSASGTEVMVNTQGNSIGLNLWIIKLPIYFIFGRSWIRLCSASGVQPGKKSIQIFYSISPFLYNKSFYWVLKNYQTLEISIIYSRDPILLEPHKRARTEHSIQWPVFLKIFAFTMTSPTFCRLKRSIAIAISIRHHCHPLTRPPPCLSSLMSYEPSRGIGFHSRGQATKQALYFIDNLYVALFPSATPHPCVPELEAATQQHIYIQRMACKCQKLRCIFPCCHSLVSLALDSV